MYKRQVEDNYITGTLADLVTPIQLWRVDNATVKDNAIVVTDSGDHQAINISKMEEDAQIEITGNMIRGVGGGIYVTTWLLGGRTEGAPGKFTGTVEIMYNTLYCAESEMDPIFAGYEKAPAASGQYYGAFEGTLTVGGNTNNGDPAVAVVGQVPRITATFQDGSTVIDKITGCLLYTSRCV